MSKIGLHNYEAWFLDYSEGNLTENQMMELEVFLEQHPNLKQELTDFEVVLLQDSEDIAVGELFKNALVREETTRLTKTDYLMISEVENEISPENKAELSALVKSNPNLLNDLALYHKTRLPVDKAVLFPNKGALVQKERKIIAWWTYASTVAAAAVIAFVIWNTNLTDELYSPRGIAWEYTQELNEERLQSGIVSKERTKEQETIENNIPSAVNNQLAQVITKNPQKSMNETEIKSTPSIQEPIQEEGIAEQTENNPTQEKVKEEVPLIEKNNDDALAEMKPIETNNDFVPIGEFAKGKLKKDLLQGKTFTETVLEEIADISNDKITLEVNEKKEGLFESFALSIGKISISRNR